MKYIIYARRSSEDKKKQIQSIPDQLEWAEKKKEQLGVEIIETFTDSKTAKEPGRDGFNKMVKFINEQKEPVGILCWKVNRLARNPIDEGAIKFAFIRGKIKHILASDRQFKENESQILMGVEFGAATQFSIDLAKDVNRGLQTKIKKGHRPTCSPLGFLNDPHGIKGEKQVFSDPERWKPIKDAWKKLLSGAYTVPQIKKELDSSGFLTRRGYKVSPSTLYDIFTNTFYAGIYEWQGKIEKGFHEAMITIEEFDQAQIILGRRGKPRMQKHEHAFTGIVRCAECGCMITAEPPKLKKQKNGKVHIYHYVRCSKKNRQQKCKQKYIRLEQLEEQIVNILESIEIPESFAKWAFKQLRKENKEEANESIAKKSALQKQLNENDRMLQGIVDKLAKGTIDDETYKNTRKRYEEEGIRIKEQLTQYLEDKSVWLDKVEATFYFASNARKRFAKGDKQKKREIFVELGSKFWLKDGELSVELKKPFQILQKGVRQTKSLFPSLEPLENMIDMPKTEEFNQLIPIWSHLSDSNR